MAAPPAYLDECIDYHLVARLQRRGFDVRHVYDESTKGDGDDQQLEYATRHGWVFVTQNQREFQRRHQLWQQQGRQHGGLVLVPQSSLDLLELRTALLLDWLAARLLAASFLIRWHDLQVLLVQGYRVSQVYSEPEVRAAIGWPPLNRP
jgi:hypothetical protein